MRGRKPKPTAKKKLEGNPGKRKLNKREPQPKVTNAQPERPIALANAVDGIAIEATVKKFTDRYFSQLQSLGLLTDADHAAFEMMSIHYALAWVSMGIIQRAGLEQPNVNGGNKKHPLLQVVRENSSAFRAYAVEFGLTPSARARLQIPLPDDGSTQLEMELFGETIQVST